MPEWQERLTRDTHPTIRIEHELRYRIAAPLVEGAATWCDLGCGTGVAAAAGLAGARPQRTVLVDLDADAAAQAAAELGITGAQTMTVDLATAEGLTALREAALQNPGGGVITCFEVIEHLASFVGVVEVLVALTGQPGFTVVLSVPNDAFSSIENPYHRTMWGAGAVEELRRLLPADHVAAAQVPLTGSVLIVDGSVPATPAPLGRRDDPVPSHFLVAFGPRAHELGEAAVVEMSDLDGQRSWERQRESNLAFHEAELAELRAYVHDLERRLGERTPVDADADAGS